MTKKIDTLVEDIKNLLEHEESLDPHDIRLKDAIDHLGEGIKKKVFDSLTREKRKDGKGKLYFSNIGRPCDRQLWYSINTPEVGEKLPYHVRIKFLFGDIAEELLFFLARLTGHTVTGEQDRTELNGVSGKRDGIIDGHLVDAKSASSRAYQKFITGLSGEDDPFGYLAQLGLYLETAQDDPEVTDKKSASFYVIDKTLGHITLDTHEGDLTSVDYQELIKTKKEMVEEEYPPARAYIPVPDGKSGNMKLDTACSYCPFKETCWPNLRTFLYSTGPRYLTVVNKQPNVTEVTNNVT